MLAPSARAWAFAGDLLSDIARCRDTATNPPTFRLLVYASGVWFSFEVPKGEHTYDGSRLHSQFLATLYADTPRDD